MSPPSVNAAQRQHEPCDENCLVHRVAALPLVKGAVGQAATGYELAKGYSPRTVSMVESTFGYLTGKAEPYYDRWLYDYVVAASSLGCRGLDALEAKYPAAIKVTPDELRQIGADYYNESYVKAAADTVVAKRQLANEKLSLAWSAYEQATLAARAKVAAASRALLSSVDYCDELVDRYIVDEEDAVEGDGCMVGQDASVSARLTHMGHKAKRGLAARAHRQREHVAHMAADYAQQLRGALALVDYARGRLSSTRAAIDHNVRSLAQRVDTAAKQYGVTSEQLLLGWLQNSSAALLAGAESLARLVHADGHGAIEEAGDNAEDDQATVQKNKPSTLHQLLELVSHAGAYLKLVDATCHEAHSLADVRRALVAGAGSALGGAEAALAQALAPYVDNAPLSWMGFKKSPSPPTTVVTEEAAEASRSPSVSSTQSEGSDGSAGGDAPVPQQRGARYVSCDSDAE